MKEQPFSNKTSGFVLPTIFKTSNLFKVKTLFQQSKQVIQALNLRVSPDNNSDILQISKIIAEILKFPSPAHAYIHQKSARLGNFDLKQNQAQYFQNQLENGGISDKNNQPQGQRICKCCGLVVQKEGISLATSLMDVNHIGSSLYLYFFTIKNLAILLTLLFLIFSLFALITNVIASNHYKESLKGSQVDGKLNTFNGLLIASFGSKKVNQSQFGKISSIIQSWLGAITMIVWAIGLFIIKYKEKKHEEQIDIETISPADFTLLFEDLPKFMTKQQLQFQLKEYQRVVRQQFNQLSTSQRKSQRVLGSLLEVNFQIAKINFTSPFYIEDEDFQDDKLEAINKQYNEIKNSFYTWIKQRRTVDSFNINLQERNKLYKRFQQLKNSKKQLYSKLAQQLKERKIRQATKLDQIDAFVTFKNSANKQLLERLHQSQSSLLYRIPFLRKFSYYSYKNFQGTDIARAMIHQAPEPEDIYWVNYGQSKAQKIKIYVFTFSVTVVTLCISFFLIALLTKLQMKFKKEYQQNDNSIRNFIFSQTSSLGLIVMNSLIPIILSTLTKRERNTSYTLDQTSIGIKSAFVVLLNTILVPIIVNKVYKQNVYGQDGLTEDITSFAVSNAFITPLKKLFNPSFIVGRIKQLIYTIPIVQLYLSVNQKDLNENYEYMQFELSEQYVEIVNNFLFSCFFVSLQPLVALFTIIQYVLFYWIQKAALFKLCKRPIPGTRIISDAMYQFIYFGPFLYALGSFCWTNKAASDEELPNLISAFISFVIIIFPYKLAVREYCNLNGEEKQFIPARYMEERIFFSSQYDRLNPATSQSAHQQFKKYLKFFMQRVSNMPKQKQLQFFARFRKQNGVGGPGKNIYSGFVDHDDEDLLAQQFEDPDASVNPYVIGKALQKMKEIQEDWELTKKNDLAKGKDSLKLKHIKVIVNENDIVNQYLELQQYFESIQDDQYLKDTPIFLKVGQFKNAHIIISLFDPNDPNKYPIDDDGQYDSYNSAGQRKMLFSSGEGFGGFGSNSGNFDQNEYENYQDPVRDQDIEHSRQSQKSSVKDSGAQSSNKQKSNDSNQNQSDNDDLDGDGDNDLNDDEDFEEENDDIFGGDEDGNDNHDDEDD